MAQQWKIFLPPAAHQVLCCWGGLRSRAHAWPADCLPRRQARVSWKKKVMPVPLWRLVRLVEGPLCFWPGHFQLGIHHQCQCSVFMSLCAEEHLAGPQWLRKVVSHTAVFGVNRNALTYDTIAHAFEHSKQKKHLGVGVWELRTWAVPSLPQIAPIRSLALQITLRQRWSRWIHERCVHGSSSAVSSI